VEVSISAGDAATNADSDADDSDAEDTVAQLIKSYNASVKVSAFASPCGSPSIESTKFSFAVVAKEVRGPKIQFCIGEQNQVKLHDGGVTASTSLIFFPCFQSKNAQSTTTTSKRKRRGRGAPRTQKKGAKVARARRGTKR